MNRARNALRRFALAGVFVATGIGLAAGQTPPAAVCVGFNHLTTASSGGYGAGGPLRVGVRIQVAATVSVESIEWWFLATPPIRVSVNAAQNGGLPLAAPSASATTFTGVPFTGWNGPAFFPPVVLMPGTWWVVYSSLPVSFGSEWLGVENAPPGLDATTCVQPGVIPFGSGCSVHLEPVTFLDLITLGLNPVDAGTTSAAGATGLVIPIPAAPAHATNIVAR